MIKMLKLSDKVYHVIYPTTNELGRAFMPLQEFYENVQFADTEFTREEFNTWYSDTYETVYEEDWSGFNIPLYMLSKFRSSEKLTSLVESDPLSKELFEFLSTHLDETCYVIGTAENSDPATLEHEKHHARFYVDPDYRAAVTSIITESDPLLMELKETLVEMSYHPKVLLDECHAYLAVETEFLMNEGLWKPEFKDIKERILKL